MVQIGNDEQTEGFQRKGHCPSNLDLISDAMFDWAEEFSKGKLEFSQAVAVSDMAITITTDFFNVSLTDPQIEFINGVDMIGAHHPPFEKFTIVKGLLTTVDGTLSVKRIPDGGARIRLEMDTRSPIERLRSKYKWSLKRDREFLFFLIIHFSFFGALLLISIVLILKK